MCYRETVTEAGLTPKCHGDGVGRKGLHPVKEVASLSEGVVLKKQSFKKKRASLVAQWLRIRLTTQGTWVRALVREDPTCDGATKPV